MNSIALLLLFSGQFPDLLDVSGQYLPSAELADPKPSRAQITSYDASLNVPIVLASKSFLVLGASYHVDSLSYSRVPAGFTELRAFHGVDLSALFVQLLPKDWSISARVSGGLAGDFARIDHDLLRLNAMLMATYSFSERFILGGGALTTFSFGQFLPLPAVYLEWTPLDALKLELFIPAFLKIRYTLADRIEFGAGFDISGNEYGVRDSRIRESWPCTDTEEMPKTPNECLDHVAYSVGYAGLSVGVRLFGSVWMTLTGGASIFRRLDLKNQDGDLVSGGRQSLPNVLMFRGGLTWRIPRD